MKGNKFLKINERRNINKNLIIFSKKRHQKKEIYFQLLIIIISLTFTSIMQINGESKTSLVINGEGLQKIIHDKYNSSLSKVYINSEEHNDIQNIYHFTLIENNVTLELNYIASCCDNMFKNLENITQIDLSQFNNYNNTNMENMFYNCVNLNSINFGDFKTKEVKNMISVFVNCNSLKSLNLEKFDTNKVISMENMFWLFNNSKFIKFCHHIINFNEKYV